MSNAQIHQLLAIRAMVDSMLADLTSTEGEQCEHKRKENLNTLGGPEHWKCLDCGYEYNEAELDREVEKRFNKEE